MIDTKNLFLTGPRHVGKSTILAQVLENVSVPVGGFRVERVYEGKRLRCFHLVDLMSGNRTPIASARKGGWEIHVQGFETLGAEALRRAMRSAGLIVMDELGRFELDAPVFRATVAQALSCPIPVIGVLKAEPNPFLDAIRARDDTLTEEVTADNRAEVALRLHEWLARAQARLRIRG